MEEENEEEVEDIHLKPSHYVCGPGSEINCLHWDSIDGCLNGCKEFGEEKCECPEDENECEWCGNPESECDCVDSLEEKQNVKNKTK